MFRDEDEVCILLDLVKMTLVTKRQYDKIRTLTCGQISWRSVKQMLAYVLDSFFEGSQTVTVALRYPFITTGNNIIF